MAFFDSVVPRATSKRDGGLSPLSRARANVLGVGIDAVNMRTAVSAIDAAVAAGHKGYVCVTGVHGVMEAQRDERLRTILNNSFVTTPDGMPTVWLGRWQGFRGMDRVYGPDLMLEICKLSSSKGYTQFLYGGKPGVAEQSKPYWNADFLAFVSWGPIVLHFGA